MAKTKAPKTLDDLSPTERAALDAAAQKIGIPARWLFGLVRAESGWNPQAKNPRSTARGLIQWIDSTARGLGYRDSLDLVTRHPTRESQLAGPVVAYLSKFRPIRSAEELAAANFYPAYRGKLDAALPAAVQRANPGIKTLRDYYTRHLARHIPPAVPGLLLAVLAGGALFF
jgi:hypothetical protein